MDGGAVVYLLLRWGNQSVAWCIDWLARGGILGALGGGLSEHGKALERAVHYICDHGDCNADTLWRS